MRSWSTSRACRRRSEIGGSGVATRPRRTCISRLVGLPIHAGTGGTLREISRKTIKSGCHCGSLRCSAPRASTSAARDDARKYDPRGAGAVAARPSCPVPDFRAKVFTNFAVRGRERKNKFSKGCSSLGYNIVRASKRSRFQAPKSPIPWKIVRCTQQEAGPYDKNQGFV